MDTLGKFGAQQEAVGGSQNEHVEHGQRRLTAGVSTRHRNGVGGQEDQYRRS